VPFKILAIPSLELKSWYLSEREVSSIDSLIFETSALSWQSALEELNVFNINED
jgi:hypothetical protein